MKGRRLAAVAFMAMVLISTVLVACDVYMDGGTAVQEVFENDLIEDGVYLADGSGILTIKPAYEVPEEIDHYEVRVYRHGESKAVSSFDVPYENKDIEVALSIQRGLYDIEVVGVHQKADSSSIVVCKGSFEGYSLTKAGEGVTVELSDVGHIMVHYERVAPTCEKDGNIEYWYCKRCERNFQDEEGTTLIVGSVVLGKLHPQSLVKVEAVDATCTREGNIEYWKCPVCGNWYRDGLGESLIENKADVVVAKIPHKPDAAWHHDSSCPDQHWHECTVCGLKVDVESHTWGDGVVTKEPTEKEQGERTYTCNVCDATRVEPMDPTGEHEWETVAFESKEPTCTEDGYFKYKCKDCDAVKTDVLKALGHDDEHSDTVAAGCENAGLKEYWHCKRCNKYFLDAGFANETTWEEIVIPANGHQSDTWCDDGETGNGHWKVCEVCGKSFDSGEHTLVENPEDRYRDKQATCTSPAIYYKSCETCGWKSDETFKHGTVTGHTLKYHEQKEPKCNAEGNWEYWECLVCEEWFKDALGKNHVEDKQRDIIRGKTDHEPSGSYDYTSVGHRPICKNCGEGYGDYASHIHGVGDFRWQPIDDKQHSEKCTACGYEFPNTRENHEWVNGYCKCGKPEPDKPSSPGLDITVGMLEPEGVLNVSHTPDNVWTFEYRDTNPKSKAEHWRWFVDGKEQIKNGIGIDSNVFVLESPRKRSYTIMCEFWNEQGIGSCDAMITGI